jgi:hypothetical protein
MVLSHKPSSGQTYGYIYRVVGNTEVLIGELQIDEYLGTLYKFGLCADNTDSYERTVMKNLRVRTIKIKSEKMGLTSISPSMQVSSKPSHEPSIKPSIAPIKVPSVIPTKIPSIMNTLLPSSIQTAAPSRNDSMSPSHSSLKRKFLSINNDFVWYGGRNISYQIINYFGESVYIEGTYFTIIVI